MKLCNLILNNHPSLGAEIDGRLIDVRATLAASAVKFDGFTLEHLLEGWPQSFDQLGELLSRAREAGDLVPVDGEPIFLPPIRRPGTFRDFYAFEEHVRNARRLRGLDIAPEWYQFPVFYFSNPNTISTTGATVRFPRKSRKWDYELEVGALLGAGGSDLTPDKGEQLIAGYLVLNDWSARDIQRAEMVVSMGPAKGKDFATSISPYLVTPDEIDDRRSGKGFDLRMTATINGELRSDGNWKTIHYSIGEMIARASEDAAVYRGDLIGSGTVGMGCLLERGLDHDLWLKSGDIVELAIERLGTLTNRIA